MLADPLCVSLFVTNEKSRTLSISYCDLQVWENKVLGTHVESWKNVFTLTIELLIHKTI